MIRSLLSRTLRTASAFALILSAATAARAQAPGASLKEPNDSLRHEVEHSIDLGLAWLKGQQKPEGFWSNADYPALTALVLTAYEGNPAPGDRSLSAQPEAVRKGYDWILSCAKPDGGIYAKGLSNYNTSICLTALAAARDSKFDPVLLAGRHFLIGRQQHLEGSPNDGGFSYDAGGEKADLSNTVYALEAIYHTRVIGSQPEGAPSPALGNDLDWKAALGFLERCQNLTAYNKETWASDDPVNKGGFVYFPGKSTAGTTDLGNGRTALRSYGTMSYAGLLSYIFADLKKDDPRVTAAYDWLQVNYTVEENPGMGPEGMYYYFNLMSKALTAYGVGEMNLPNGSKVNWREQVARKLIDLQDKDGFWQNANGRWFEKDPVLASSYSLIALELIDRGL